MVSMRKHVYDFRRNLRMVYRGSMTRYYVSIRFYNACGDCFGEEWKLTTSDVIKLRLYLEDHYGKGSEL